MVAHEAQVMTRGFNHYPDAAKAINEDLLFSLTNHALIIVSKFLEVWDDSNGFAKTDPRVIPMRKVLKPFLDRIYLWTGLKGLRNSGLAHAYLDKQGNLAPPWQPLGAGKAPTYHAEIILLLQLVYLSVLVILTVFHKEYAPIDPLCGPGSTHEVTAGPGITHGSEIKTTLNPLAQQVEQRLKEGFGMVVQGPLLKAFIQATRPDAA